MTTDDNFTDSDKVSLAEIKATDTPKCRHARARRETTQPEPSPKKADLTFYEAAQPIVDAYNNFSLAVLDLAKPLLLALTIVAERFVNTVEKRQITIKRSKIEPPQ